MRVLQAMAGAEYGGAEAFFVRLATGLHRAGLEQHLLIRSHPRRAASLRAAGLTVTEAPFGGFFDWRTGRSFSRAVQDFRPDIVLTWMNRATRFCPKGDFVHAARLGGYYDLKYYRACDHLIGNTQDIVDYLSKSGWPADRAHYLPNFVSAAQAPAIARKAFFTPDGAPLIFALGRLHPNKAFDVLLEALARVPDAYLWLAGEGPERTALESLAARLGVKPRVRFLGWREDVAALYAAANVFVCPSRHEPLGNVVIEAWAQGKPVIAADAIGPGTLIQHGKTGLLFPVDDASALAAALVRLLSNPNDAARLAAAGAEEYAAHFTEQAVVDRYMDFFAAIGAQGKASPQGQGG